MIKFKKVASIMLCFFICLGTMPLTSIIAEAQGYPDGVSKVTAKYDDSNKKIIVDYYLDSDSRSGPGTLSIGYKFNNQQLNTYYSEQFVKINGAKGHHVAYLSYPGFPARVNIYTRYKVGYGNSQLGGGIQYENKKITIIPAPTKPIVTPARKVNSEDVARQWLLITAETVGGGIAGGAVLKIVPGSARLILTKVPYWLDVSLGVGASLGYFTQSFPILKVGQVIEVTTTYKNGEMHETIKIWVDERSHKMNATPLYVGTSSVLVL